MARRGTLTLRREDGRVICESVQVADSLGRRLVGLLGRKSLARDTGMMLRPSFSIHTAFMRFAIDVVFVDHNQTVIRIDPGLGPFRTASCRGAREVIELAAGECARRGLEVGDRIAWAPRGVFEEGPTKETALPAATSRGSVLIASSDARFSKLARFLLQGKNVDVIDTVDPGELIEALDDRARLVLLDIGDAMADGLRLANAVRSARPEVHLVLAGEQPDDNTFAGLRVYDRWNEVEQLIDAVIDELEQGADGAETVGLIA
jgi:uncharacterized membrane protein (UPF0127 family)/CheY-like chemotaxis protein